MGFGKGNKKESKETGVLDRSYCLAIGPQCNVQGSSAQSLGTNSWCSRQVNCGAAGT